MQIKTANTILYCRNWQDTVAFYKDKLRFRITVENDWFVEFEVNRMSRLSIADCKRSSQVSCRGKGLTITLEVEDIEAVRSRLQERGVDIQSIRRHPWGARVMYLSDPEGNRLEFWTPQSER